MADTDTKKPRTARPKRQGDTEAELPQAGTAESPPVAVSEPDPVPERRFATPDMLGGDEATTEMELPVLAVWVKVRFLSQEDVLHLGFIPDYAGFIEMATKASALARKQESGQKLTAKEKRTFQDNRIAMEADQLRYQHHLAHLALVHPDVVGPEGQLLGDPEPCTDCTPPDLASMGQFVRHPKSLWSLTQTKRLSSVDTDIVVAMALHAEHATVVRPFSQDPTPLDSAAPAPTTE